jgi:hypothetical protein
MRTRYGWASEYQTEGVKFFGEAEALAFINLPSNNLSVYIGR